jgi:hypothetical protein
MNLDPLFNMFCLRWYNGALTLAVLDTKASFSTSLEADQVCLLALSQNATICKIFLIVSFGSINNEGIVLKCSTGVVYLGKL